jgi:hypothetical protein
MKLIPAKWAVAAARLFLFFVLATTALLAQAPPSADTFTANSSPRTNYGGWPLLVVQQGSNTYLQFNLSNVPANASVTKATLRVYVDAVSHSGNFDVFEIDHAWSESTLTYSNAPPLGSSATGGHSTSVSPSSLNQFVEIDITPLVQQWVAGTLPNNGIALSLTTSSGSFSFDSKEATYTSHEPELEIALAGNAGPQGPPGPQGPQGPQGEQGPPGNLTPGSPYYIQNGTATQSGASFNIDGSGTVGGTLAGKLMNSTNGYQIGGATILNNNSANDLIIGNNAGNSTMTGAALQIIGDGAGQAVTTGNSDVFIGTHAGQQTTTGNGDVYIGLVSGAAGTTAAYNTFVGAQTGTANTTGSNNTFVGFNAGVDNTTGYLNAFFGQNAGISNTTGAYNVAVGAGAAQGTTTALGNVVIGYTAGEGLSTGGFNTLVGGQTGGTSGETSSNNSFFGWDAGTNNTTGQNNLFLGAYAGANNVAGSNDIYLMANPGDESNTIRIGGSQQAAFIAGIYGASTSGGQAVYIDSTGHLGTGGGSGGSGVSSFNGRSGAVVSASGDYNFSQLSGTVASSQLTGTFSQQLTLSNTANVYTGASIGVAGTAAANLVNTVNGYQIAETTVFTANPGLNNIAIGVSAGNSSATGGDNQFIGRSTGAAVTTGNADVFVGGGAGATTTTGNGNVYVGWVAGASGTSGAYNTFVGAQTGYFSTTGTSNLFLGFSSGINNTTGSGNIYLDNGGTTEDNTIRIGGGQSSTYIAGIYGVTSASGVPVYINSDGQLGTQTSSRIYKQNIRDMGDSTSALMRLRPVTFLYKPEYDKGQRTLQYGLIAEEVAKVYPDLVAYNPDGTPYTVRYQFLSSMLLNEVQKQYRRAEDQAQVIEQQQQQINELQERLAHIEKMLSGAAAGGDTTHVAQLPASTSLAGLSQ